MRKKRQDFYTDGAGNILAGGTVTVYLAGTTTLATIYATATGASPVAASTVTVAADGSYLYYVDTADYDNDQLFKEVAVMPNYQTQTFDDLAITDYVPGTYSIITDTTIATQVIQPKSVVYTVASGKTLTFSGTYDAGRYNTFDGAGTIALGINSVEKILPHWWKTSSRSWAQALQFAVTATGTNRLMAFNGMNVNLGGAYSTRMPDFSTLDFTGSLLYTTTTGLTAMNLNPLWDGTANRTYRGVVKGLYLYNQAGTAGASDFTGTGLQFYGMSGMDIEHLRIRGYAIGLDIWPCDNLVISDARFTWNTTQIRVPLRQDTAQHVINMTVRDSAFVDATYVNDSFLFQHPFTHVNVERNTFSGGVLSNVHFQNTKPTSWAAHSDTHWHPVLRGNHYEQGSSGIKRIFFENTAGRFTVSGAGVNNGTYTLASVAAGTLTLTASDSLTAVGAGSSVTLTSVANPAVTITANTIAFVASSPATITDSGSGFITAGFVAGQPYQKGRIESEELIVPIGGYGAWLENCQNFTLANCYHAGTGLTVTDAACTSASAVITSATGGFLTCATGNPIFMRGIPMGTAVLTVDSDNQITANANATATHAAIAMTASTIAFVNSNPDTITDSANGFVAAGLTAGMRVKIAGSVTANNHTFTIATVAAGTLTLTPDAVLTAAIATPAITLTSGNVLTVNRSTPMWLNADCTGIRIDNPSWGTGRAVYLCDRKEIIINGGSELLQPNFVLPGWDAATFGAGTYTGIIRMEEVLTTYYPATIHPKGYMLRVTVSDTASAAGTTHVRLAPTAAQEADLALAHNMYLKEMANGEPKTDYFVVQADTTTGDIYYRIVTSAAGTLTISIGIIGYLY